MRFHIGFSKYIKPSTLLKILGSLFVGACAYFGLTQHAFAESNGTISNMVPNAMYFHTNSSGSDLSPTQYGTKTCAFDSSSTCFYMYGYNVNGFAPLDFNFIYNAKNVCSNNDNIANVTIRGIIQNPPGTNVTGNLQTYSNNVLKNNFSISFLPNAVFTTVVTYNTSNVLRLRFNSSLADSSIYYMELTTNNTYTCDYTLAESTDNIINNNNNNTNSIINNNNSNTQSIIDSQSDNTQDIIDNQNSNTQAILDSNKENFQDCRPSLNLFNWRNPRTVSLIKSTSRTASEYSSNNIVFEPGTYTLSFPDLVMSNNIFPLIVELVGVQGGARLTGNHLTFTVNEEKTLRYIYIAINTSDNDNATATFSKIMIQKGSVATEYEAFDQEVCSNRLQGIVDSNHDINNSLNDSNTSSSTSTQSSWFSNFTIDDSKGLSSIVTAPLRLLQGLVNGNNSCSSYSFSINMGSNLTKNVSLPSGCILWNNVPSAIILLYWSIVFGLFGYRILVDMYHFWSSLHDPDKKNEFVLEL